MSHPASTHPTRTARRGFATTLAAALMLIAFASDARAQVTGTSAPAPGSTTINFNALPDGTVLTNQLAAQGVTVSGYACVSSFYNGFFAGDPRQLANAQVGNCASTGFSGTASPVTFIFSSPINSFGFNGANNAGSQLTFTTAGGSYSVNAPLFVNPFVGINSVTPFTSVTVSAGTNPAFILDNLSFAATTVAPEPASVVLFATGLVGVFGASRRKRNYFLS